MSASKQTIGRIANRLLAALSPDEYKRLSANLELVQFPRNRILCEAGDILQYVYFLTSGMVSLLAITEDGRGIELSLVGSDGYVGIPIIHEADTAPYRVLVQTPVTALRIEAKTLKAELTRGGLLRRLLLRYAHDHEIQLVQTVVCSLSHSVEQRLARQLLVTGDYLQSDALSLTQEHLGLVLDRSRNRIGMAASVLQRKDLIEHDRRGCITILDRQGLEASACDCYHIIKESKERVW